MDNWRARELGRQGKSHWTVLLLVALALLLSPLWVPALANGQETCPQISGWVKIDSDDLSLYPVDGATDYCFKAGSNNSRGCQGGIFDTWPQPEGTCGLSHWSYFIPEEEPTDEPTPTNTPDPTATPEPTGEPTDEPTVEPTASPTDAPLPTPTDAPTGTPTETPTNVPDGEPTEEPTDEPKPDIEVQRLPDTGDGLSPEPWLCWGTNVWCAHNSVEGSPGESWVFLYPGATVEFGGVVYTVERVERVPASEVSVLDGVANYSVVLLTCTNYYGGAWLERIVVFANLGLGVEK